MPRLNLTLVSRRVKSPTAHCTTEMFREVSRCVGLGNPYDREGRAGTPLIFLSYQGLISVVARARNHLQANRLLKFCFQISASRDPGRWEAVVAAHEWPAPVEDHQGPSEGDLAGRRACLEVRMTALRPHELPDEVTRPGIGEIKVVHDSE